MTTLQDVLTFCMTADSAQRILINSILNPTPNRAAQAAASLSAFKVGSSVSISHAGVEYTGTVVKLNNVSASVQITSVVGNSQRSRPIAPGQVVRVSAGLLKPVAASATA